MNLPFDVGGRYEANGVDTSDSGGTRIVAHASANTKGSYVQLTAATSFQYEGIYICFPLGSTANVGYVFDIAIGASAEAIIVENLQHNAQPIPVGVELYLPVRVPEGARIAARCQCTTGGAGSDIIVTGVAGSSAFPPGGSKAVGIATDLSDSGGQVVDPGATANTKGAYAPLVASTADEYAYISPVIGTRLVAARAIFSWLFDVAIGAEGAEINLLENLSMRSDSTGDGIVPQHFPSFPVDIPLGSRLSARAQGSNTGSTNRLFDLSLMGIVP